MSYKKSTAVKRRDTTRKQARALKAHAASGNYKLPEILALRLMPRVSMEYRT